MAAKQFPKRWGAKFVQIALNGSVGLFALDEDGNIWACPLSALADQTFKWEMIPNNREVLTFIDGTSMDINEHPQVENEGQSKMKNEGD